MFGARSRDRHVRVWDSGRLVRGHGVETIVLGGGAESGSSCGGMCGIGLTSLVPLNSGPGKAELIVRQWASGKLRFGA